MALALVMLTMRHDKGRIRIARERAKVSVLLWLHSCHLDCQTHGCFRIHSLFSNNIVKERSFRNAARDEVELVKGSEFCNLLSPPFLQKSERNFDI